MATVVRHVQKELFNQVWKKFHVLFVHVAVHHQRVLLYVEHVVLDKNKLVPMLIVLLVSIVKLAKYLKLEIQPVKVALLVFINPIRVKERVNRVKLVRGVIQWVAHRR